ncbi:cytochrome b561 domain-containing protein At2g30890-like isoform X2 [Punica granatum]|uniref:Cytochrome b561 domain-containing protein At2g30890-like isoform X2 n=2 Tax=Punica granatum TaxID=22663 RepID=A0A6P8D5K4_PUNGR|nr:cytochrome b561 domain-containing protein At2g30890-like isoform X2 [Punica granatum]
MVLEKQMRVSGIVVSFTTRAFLLVLSLPAISSSQENPGNAGSSSDKVNSQLMYEITAHGFLLWASLGFLMPIGILTIRMANGEEISRKRATALFRAHAILQMLSVLLSTVAAIMSIKNFNNSFNNGHQRIGIVLYGLIWVQAITGFARPQRGSRGRSMWFLGHWALGTVVALLGVINIYTGLLAYHEKTSRSISTWTIIFTAETSIIALLYLIQDKWVYIQKSQSIARTDSSKSTDETASPNEKQNGLQLA